MSPIALPTTPQRERCALSQKHKDTIESSVTTYGPRMFEDVGALETKLGNKPVFTRALLDQAAEQMEQVRAGDPSGRKEMIRLPHLGNGVATLRIPTQPSNAVHITWTRAFAAACKQGKTPVYNITPRSISKNLCSAACLKPNDPEHPLRQQVAALPPPTSSLLAIQNLQTQFLSSNFWAAMHTHLDHLTAPVQNIVCVALGPCFSNGEEGALQSRSALQHMLACALSSHLSPSPSAPIPILAHDPEYTSADMHLLEHLSPPITVLGDPHHYLAITPATLLLSISIPAFIPVFEIAANLCFPTGPAAILSNEIFQYPWHGEGRMVSLDQRTPRVGRMLGGYGEEWVCKRVVGGGDGDGEGREGWGEESLVWYARRE